MTSVEQHRPGFGRRSLLLALPGAALAAASAVRAAEAGVPASTMDQVRHHIEAIASLLRSEFPNDTTRLTVSASADFIEGETYISAHGLRLGWEENERLRGGGLWVERSTGRWTCHQGYEAEA